MVQWEPSSSGATATGWWKFVTPNLTLYTDLGEADGREAVDAIEREIVVLRAMMGSAPTRAVPVQVIVLADGLEYEKHFGRLTVGIVDRGSNVVNVFLWGRPEKWARRASVVEGAPSLITHELAHVVLNQYLGAQPRWFAEGFAQFLEAYRWSGDGKRVELGLANHESYRIYRRNRAIGFADVHAWGTAQAGEREATTRARYGYSWALVHYLINVDPQRFAAILGALAADEELTSNLVTPDPAALDKSVHAYIKTGDYSTFEIEVAQGSIRGRQAPMYENEVAEVRKALEATGRAFSRQ